MTRLMLIVFILGLSTAQVGAQEPAAAPPNAVSPFPPKAELLRRIDLYEAALLKPEITHGDDASLATVYTSLGTCYLEAAMYPKAEAAMQRAMELLSHGSPVALADETGQLAVLHVAMGDLKQAVKDQMDALQIREQIGDPVGIALTWNDLAGLYVAQRQFPKALDYALRAMPVLASNPEVQATDRIAVRQTLAYALCGTHQCDRAIRLLREALELSRDNFGADSLNVGFASYLLGYACWQSGQMDEAADQMQRGVERMKTEWGWGQTLYVNAVQQYAKFLRQRGQIESAILEERELRRLTASVDARTFVAH